MKSGTFIIVGGGVIGLSAAFHLERMRAGRVIVMETGTFGGGSSSRAAGITTQLMWNETGVRARQRGIDLFKKLSIELDDYTYHDENGCLNLFTPETWPNRRALLPLYDRLGAPYEVLTAEQIHMRWPDINPRAEWIGLHDPRGGYSESDEYLAALVRHLRQSDVDLREGCPVDEFLLRGDHVVGVRSGDEQIHADSVISTVHAWSHTAWKQLNLRFPMKTFVHQRYVTAPLPQRFNAPPINADPLTGYIRPARGDRILLGVETPNRVEHKVTSRDFMMSQLETPRDVRDSAARQFEQFAPHLIDAQWESEHIGLLSFTIDGDPFLGPTARFPGLIIGAAFHSGGFSYNTVAGELLAEFATRGATSIDVSAFSPDRYSPDDTIAVDAYLNTTIRQSEAVKRRH